MSYVITDIVSRIKKHVYLLIIVIITDKLYNFFSSTCKLTVEVQIAYQLLFIKF